MTHILASIAFDGNLHCSRGINNSKGANHDAHPTGNTGWFVHINQPRLGVPSHGSIGAGLNARGFLAMAALESKIFPLDINPWYRLRFFMDGLIKFFGYRSDFCSAPKFALMASGTFRFIHY